MSTLSIPTSHWPRPIGEVQRLASPRSEGAVKALAAVRGPPQQAACPQMTAPSLRSGKDADAETRLDVLAIASVLELLVSLAHQQHLAGMLRPAGIRELIGRLNALMSDSVYAQVRAAEGGGW